MSTTYTQQHTYLVEPSPIYSTINYMTNIASTPAITNSTTITDDADALFEIDDVDTPLYSSSCHSVPSLIDDTNPSEDDDDLFDVEDDEPSSSQQQQQQYTTWNPTLLSPLLQPKSVHQSKRTSLSFDSVLINSLPTRKMSSSTTKTTPSTSVAEQNYKIWLSSN